MKQTGPQSSRQVIMSRIRKALGTNRLPNKTQRQLQKRLSPPFRTTGPRQSVDVEKFCSKAVEAAATISVLSGIIELPDEIRRYLKSKQLTTPVAIADVELLTSLEWCGLETSTSYVRDSLAISVTPAWLGIEESGTVVLRSSPASPTGFNFLPDYHVVVLNADDIVTSMENVWNELRQDRSSISRNINFITGPSRTADIEYTMQLGVHGPRNLHIVILSLN